MDAESRIAIREGKEKQLVRHHPWVYSGAIDAHCRPPEVPSVVRVDDAFGSFIAYGWYDAASHIPLRLLSWDQRSFPDGSWWTTMLKNAVQRRSAFLQRYKKETTACRLVHGEADFLPGFAIDLFGTAIICIISARVAWDHRLFIVEALDRLLTPSVILVTVDSAFCKIEHLSDAQEVYVNAKLEKMPPDTEIRFLEHGIVYLLDIGKGQKSGFFCDQRDNRLRLASYADKADMLDAFCYTGGFALNALRCGARFVEAVDSSTSALDQLARQITINVEEQRIPFDSLSRLSIQRKDVFSYLREVEEGTFNLIVLDPPKLAQTKSHVEQAMRAYKDLNRLAIMKVRKGGVIATFSCSGAISQQTFRTMLSWAAHDAKREVQVLETLGQGFDHPVRLSFPESEYLTGCILCVV